MELTLGAAELGRDPEERRVEHATAVEVGHESSDRMVERRHLVEAVPARIDVRVPLAIVDRDEPRAGFDQPAGQISRSASPLG